MADNQQFSFNFGADGAMEMDMGAMQANMAAIMEAHKETMRQENEQFIRSLPKPVRERVSVLQVLQDDFDSVRSEFLRELQELERKYEAKYAPLLERRRVIVSGEEDVTEEEKKKAQARLQEKMLEQQSGGVQIEEEAEDKKEEEEEKEKEDDEEKDIKGVPGFWKEVLVKSELNEELIQEHDVPSLDYLVDIRTEHFNLLLDANESGNDDEEDEEDKKNRSVGFHIDFVFDSDKNPFFSNEKLRKTYYLDPEDGQTIIECSGTEIDWKADNKNLTCKITIKTQRHKGGKGTRKVRREEPRKSFYNFFKSIEEQEEILEEMEDEDTVEDVEEADFEYGQMLRDRIVPRAIEYFTGEAALKYMDLVGLGDDDDDDDEEFDEEEAAAFIAEQMGRASLGRGGNAAAAAAAAAMSEQPECKQQ